MIGIIIILGTFLINFSWIAYVSIKDINHEIQKEDKARENRR